jgi:hypothetical protein
MSELSEKLQGKPPIAVVDRDEDASVFRPATKRQAKMRLALDGPSGSGKTYSALAVATALGGRIALIDTEHRSASKYANDPFKFDELSLETFEPRTYVKAILAAEKEGFDVLIIDSLSHAWAGKGGALEQVDMRAGVGGNKFAAWRDVTPMHNELVETILRAKLHIIATMRTKTEYAVDKDERGKTTVRKLGLAPVQRDGVEYEFDVVGDLDQQHRLHITKTRCATLDDAIIDKPGEQLAKTLIAWLSDGAPPLSKDNQAILAALLRTAKETPGPDGTTTPRYEAAASWRVEKGYKSWADFFSRGLESEGEELATVLSQPGEAELTDPEVVATAQSPKSATEILAPNTA